MSSLLLAFMFALVFSSLVSENQTLASRVLFRIYIDSEYITALYEMHRDMLRNHITRCIAYQKKKNNEDRND